MTVTLAVDTGDADRVLLVPVHDAEYAAVGTVATVGERIRIPGGGRAVTLEGVHRGIAGAAHTGADGRLYVDVDERPDEEPPRIKTAELEREYRALVEEILELAARFQRERLAELQVRRRIRDDVESGAQKQQREYILRRQMESIRKELGEDDESA